jgi:hypothetical protein
MKILENFVVKLLLSRSGPVLQKAFSAAAAALATFAATHVESLGQLLPAELIAGIFWAVFDALLTRFGGKVIGDHAKTLQRIANSYTKGTPLKVDGYLGPVSVEAIATELAANATQK